jgi:predicted dehydrogenase/threonine dehydrogenase-like Zn-dependent dehydrogenase
MAQTVYQLRKPPMKQLTQQLKSGKMEIIDVPFPIIGKGQVLVRNHFSVISAGTEGKTVRDARKGYLGKAKARQKEVRKVIASVKTAGLKNTYDMVMDRLESPSTLGYSCAGEVIGLGKDVRNLRVGEMVACGGQGAHHAEVVAVHRHLCVKLPETVKLQDASFTTVAAIAIQGVRQADLRLGDNCVVIGLGLIGRLTLQLLNAAGVTAIGIDTREKVVQSVIDLEGGTAFNRNRDDLEDRISQLTSGHGTDAVIITASASDSDPVNLAGSLCRQKGKVIIVGSVPTGFEREHYYRKELELRMSCSYGPGRYDDRYEEKSIDYPIGYVRWTENRNMAAFVELLSQGKVNLDKMITHVYPLDSAPDAYQMILEQAEGFSGILIEYDTSRDIKPRIIFSEKPVQPANVNIGLIGAGSFARNILLPKLKGHCHLIGIATARGNNASHMADKYGFTYGTNQVDDIFKDEQINTVIITTRHHLHAEYTLKALAAGLHVFVEKPLALHVEDLLAINKAVQTSEKANLLMVGFNRRFSPMAQAVRDAFPDEISKAIQIRINAGTLPADHWVHDPEVGGGRILGEVCHFIDLAAFLAGAPIASVFADHLSDVKNLMDTLVINLRFQNGSIASISYFSNGSDRLLKEQIEVFAEGQVAIIDDFKKMTLYGKSRSKTSLPRQDKGHAEEIKGFINAITLGQPCPIPFEQSFLSSLATHAVLDAIRLKTAIEPEAFYLKGNPGQ